ncbi:MAG: hypothetical protein KIC52_00530 [Firmicutes bacterium]|nr:hypothetical protein [Bacillota bacterium]
MRETKKALIVSGISLALCFVFMSGVTFAWFTDSVFNKGNNITAGVLTVDLLMDEKKDGNYVSIVDNGKSIFSDKKDENGYSWEPGKTEMVFLAVRNNGQLDLTYEIDLDITGELANSLEYALIPNIKKVDCTATTWDEIKQLSGVKSGAAGSDITFGENQTIVAGETQPMSYFALAIHMRENASNDVQGKSANINLAVNATQVAVSDGSAIQP